MMTNQAGVGIQKRYFDLEEVAQALSIEVKDIVHIAAHGDIPIYVLAGGWVADAFVLDDNGQDWRPSSPLSVPARGTAPKIWPVLYRGEDAMAGLTLVGGFRLSRSFYWRWVEFPETGLVR